MVRLGDWDIPEPASDPASWDELLGDVIGCVLSLFGSGEGGRLGADGTSTLLAGAVLARLWRDVRPGVINDDRLFIPQDIARRHGMDLSLLRKAIRMDEGRGCDGDARDGSCDCANMPNTAMRVVLPAYRETMHELVERTGALLTPYPALPADQRTRFYQLRAEALTDLRLVRRRRFDTLTRRPTPGALDKVIVGVRARFSR